MNVDCGKYGLHTEFYGETTWESQIENREEDDNLILRSILRI
jgi:hypothetical protein